MLTTQSSKTPTKLAFVQLFFYDDESISVAQEMLAKRIDEANERRQERVSVHPASLLFGSMLFVCQTKSQNHW